MGSVVNPNAGFKKQIIGGNELTMGEYTAYLNVLRVKPFLTASETSDLFNVGISRVQEMMNEPDCPFITRAIGVRRRLIHRERFEEYLLTHDATTEEI
jgi:hypothetical protein